MTKEQNVLLDDNQKNKIKFSPYLLFAFFLPAALFLTIYFLRETYPFGEESVLVLDLNAQYVYFFEELRDVFLGEGNLLYSWQRAVGGEFMGMFAYYLASPFNFLIAFFPEDAITEALLTIFALKAGLSGFNFAVYLHYSGRSKNKIATVFFSAMYALCAYAIVYGHNTMWIDALLFFPLLILGLESLINKRKYKLYTIMLAIIVFSNFYIGFMTCLFVLIYSVYYYMAYGYSDKYNEYKERFHLIKSILRVALFSAIALAMAAVIIFTIQYSLTFGKNDFTEPKYDLLSKLNFLDLFAKALPNSYDTVRPNGLPFIYCGALTLILIPIFFACRKITPREKICAGFIISGLLITFAATTLDIFWHGMQNPNWLNYRYSFMLCFLLIVFANQAFEHIKDMNFNHIVAVCGVLVLLVVLVQSHGYTFIDSVNCIWISLLCIGVYLLCLYAYKKEIGTNFISLILAIIISSELLINGYVSLEALDKDVVYSTRTSYRDFIDSVRPAVDYVKDKDDSFYRMEKTEHKKTNDNMALDINGISSSTSTLNASIVKLLNQLGYSSKSHWSKYLGGTPASDGLLGIKYVISKDRMHNSIYKKIHEVNGYYIYENPYAMSVAFGVDTKFEYMDDFSTYTNPFSLVNDMVTYMLGEDETVMLFKPVEKVSISTNNVLETAVAQNYMKFVPIDPSKPAEITYTLTSETIDEMFFFYPSDYPRKVSLTLNRKDWGTFFDNETDRIVSLTRFGYDQTVRLKVTLKDENLYVLQHEDFFYYLDTELYKSVMTKLNESRFNVEEHSDTYLSGNIDVKQKEMLLFTTIPYDEGWKIYCDGQELVPLKTASSLIAAEIPQGVHKLEFKYIPDCFVKGASISIIGIMVFILIIVADFTVKLYRKKKQAQLSIAINDFYETFDFPEDALNNGNVQQSEHSQESIASEEALPEKKTSESKEKEADD